MRAFNLILRVALLTVFSLRLGAAEPKVFPILDFGANGDGRTINTLAIQKAIDAAATNGGVVLVPPGIFLAGAIFLKSNVELRLAAGATLMAVTNDAAYPLVQTRIAGIEMPWPAALVNICGQHNVQITGAGVIDGNGSYWWHKFWGGDGKGGMLKDYTRRGLRWAVDYDCQRVRAVVFYNSTDVAIRGVTIERSGFWNLTFTYCERAQADGVKIRANVGGRGPSTDGIDIDSSRDVLVENCDIDANDDDICLKAGRDADGLRVNRPTEKVIIRNCITRGGGGMLTLGSETSGGIRDVEVSGLKAFGTSTGVRFKSARIRGGVVQDIRIHDVQMTDVANPFDFNLDWYPAYSHATLPANFPAAKIPAYWKVLLTPVVPAERGIPEFKDVKFTNITAKDATVAINASAFKTMPLRGFDWTNVVIETRTAGKITDAADWNMLGLVIRSADHQPLDFFGVSGMIKPD